MMTDPKPTQHIAAAKRGRSRIPHHVVLRVSVAGIEPEIWRRVRVPDNYTLHRLHRVFQLLFGWQDCHLYEFRIGERRFEEPLSDAEGEPSTRVRLRDLDLAAGDRFTYTYDFGDNWEHDVVVEELPPLDGIGDDLWLPALLGGERAGPREDSGGRDGYGEMVRALRNKRNRDHQGYREWVGPLYDPDRFDPWLAGQSLVLAAVWRVI
jgi:hypothetical protein